MLSSLRNRFGIPGVISVIALVFAMLGGAYAASDNGGGGKATASAKAKKGPRGPKGPKGDPGPAGPQGPAGPAGPAGPQGPKGDKGDAGAKGDPGAKGATGAPGAKGATGKSGATGKTGATGFSGFTATLPPESTETGAWHLTSSGGEQYTPVSFPIPLSPTAAGEIKPEKLGAGASPTANCPGNSQEPAANPGFLCIYVAAFGTTFAGQPNNIYKIAETEKAGVSTSGALLYFENIGEGETSGGSFAVTAP